MGGMNIELNFPTQFGRWATDSGRTLEPAEGVKDTGWQIDDVPPARWMNWLHNLTYQWQQKAGATVLNNWRKGTDISAGEFGVFNPSVGYWLGTNSVSTATYYSTDGWTWAAGNALSAACDVKLAIDTSNYIAVVNSNQDLNYSADAGITAWTTVASATIGGAGNIQRVATKYPDSDFLILMRNSSGTINTRIASSGVAGSWAAATTDPIPAGSSDTLWDLVYTGSSNTWLALFSDSSGPTTTLSISTDDGDTWSNTDISSAIGGTRGFGMDYHRESGRLIVCGDAGDELWYSDDLGTTWTQSTVDFKGLSTPTNDLREVRYLGGNMWAVVLVSWIVSSAGATETLLVSLDDGETWGVPDVFGIDITGGTGSIKQISSDGRKVTLFGTSGTNIHSLSTI